MFLRNSRHSSSDRFIPQRQSLNSDIANYQIKSPEIKEVEIPPPDSYNNDFINTAKLIYDINNYREKLWSAILPRPTRILTFSSPTRKSKNVYAKKAPKRKLWPVKARKKPLIGPPLIMLDMPGIETDLCHNIIDWGNKGYIATIFEGEVYLWHPEKNWDVTCVTRTSGNVKDCVKWDKSGLLVATALGNREAMVWDCKKEKKLKSFHCSCLLSCAVTTLEWSPDNRYLVTGCSYGAVQKHSKMNDGWSLRYTKAHSRAIVSIKFSCNGRFLVTNALDEYVKILKWPDLHEYIVINFDSDLKNTAWHPWNESLLAVGSLNYNSLWNVTTQKNITLQPHVHSNHAVVRADTMTFNPLSAELVVSYYCQENDSMDYGNHFITVLEDFDKIVDEVYFHNGRVPYMMWDATGTKLATAGADENLCIWEFFGSASNAKKYLKPKKRELTTDMSKTINMFNSTIR